MKYSIAVLSFLLMCLGCSSDSGGGDTMMTPGGGQGGAAGGQGGSGGEGGGPPPAMQGGGSLPTDVADCERGCLSARQCDLDECFSDVAGRLVSLCTQACQSGDRAAYANLVGASCPDAGYQAQNLLGITNECTGQSSRCQECAAEEACINGACGVFTCTPDQFDNAGNDATSAEVIDAVDTVLVARSVCTGDEDWYSVNVPAGQNLFIDTVFVHGIGDVDVKVFDGADPAVQLYQSASATDNESLVIPPTNDDRTFLIQVFPFRDAQNTYELHLNFDVPLAICTTNAQCPMGEECNANACAPIPPCFSDDDCGFVTSKCDVGSGICYECLVTEDCPSGVCNNNECVDCIGDGDCEVGRCLENECVECVDNSDCQAGNVCLGSVCGPESCLDSLEPNNSEETAVPINAGSPYDVTICSDKDYYAFSMPQGQAFVVELTFLHGDGDIDATLKQGGETVVSAVSTDDNESLFVPARLAGGDYVLYVRRLGSGAEDRAPDQSYTVFVNNNPDPNLCRDTEDCSADLECRSGRCIPMGYCESNSQCNANPDARQCDLGSNMCVPCTPIGQPSTLEMPVMINASGHSESNNTCGGRDYFAFEMPVNKLVRIVVSFQHSAGDIDARLEDAAGMTVASGLGLEDTEVLEATSEVGGMHILQVYGVGDVYNEYQLEVSTQ